MKDELLVSPKLFCSFKRVLSRYVGDYISTMTASIKKYIVRASCGTILLTKKTKSHTGDGIYSFI